MCIFIDAADTDIGEYIMEIRTILKTEMEDPQ
jgi:hypothetical protein